MWGKLSGAVVLLSISLAAAQGDTARGRYIFLVSDCNGCHSVHDYSRLGGPVIPGQTGVGQVMPPELGLPGKVVAPNITQDKATGIGAWTDAEIGHAIRGGIGRDGRTLFPMMPYYFYRTLSERDLTTLIAYLRTLPAVKNALPRTELPPQVKIPAPPPIEAVAEPDATNRVKYGEYLVTLGACVDCHTPVGPNHEPDKSKRFAGGQEFRFPGGMAVVSANITPDPETGIGKWTEQQFIARFVAYKRYTEDTPPKVGPDQFTLMPWLALSQLTREDLGSIYRYLRTVPPVKNPVRTHPGPAIASR